MPWKPPPQEKCDVCDKTVYVLEKIECDGRVFHKTCFKCEHCKRTLSLGNFAGLQGKLYCKPHFKQLFKEKGNYSDGFGADNPKLRWNGAQGGGDKEPSATSGGVAAMMAKRMNVDTCVACSKSVYQVERLEYSGRVWHKNCFRCAASNIKLDIRSVVMHDDKIYCSKHVPKEAPHVGLDSKEVQQAIEKAAIVAECSPASGMRPIEGYKRERKKSLYERNSSVGVNAEQMAAEAALAVEQVKIENEAAAAAEAAKEEEAEETAEAPKEEEPKEELKEEEESKEE